MPTQLKMSDHNYHRVISVRESVLAEIVGQTLATTDIEGGEQALMPVCNVLYRPLLRALADVDEDFDQARFAAEVEAAEASYLNAMSGDKTGLRRATLQEECP